MKIFILVFSVLVILALAAERFLAVRHRRALTHVIHVNGTRGKSAVARLIAAGLREGGLRVYCKTTGTLPMTIDCEGTERVIRRRGPANISEQIRTLGAAAKDGAQVLVIECMAVDPELQRVCEHGILHSDIGVITNARVDHVAEMGENARDVAEALSSTVPDRRELSRVLRRETDAAVYTADPAAFPIFREAAERTGAAAVLADALPEGVDPADFDFPDNAALALAVCEACGVERETALKGLSKVKRDPYAVSAHTLPGGALFVDAMSANDPLSTKLIIDRYPCAGSRIYILNCRADRGYRTGLMLGLIAEDPPDEVWLIGAGRAAARRRLVREGVPVRAFAGAGQLPVFCGAPEKEGSVIYAIGNIAGPGIDLMELVRKEGEPCTRK